MFIFKHIVHIQAFIPSINKLANERCRIITAKKSIYYTLSIKHLVWMRDKSDAKQTLTASPLENWRRPPGRPHTLRGWRLPSRTWNHWTSPWMKQLTWLRIIHSGEWCLCLVRRTH